MSSFAVDPSPGQCQAGQAQEKAGQAQNKAGEEFEVEVGQWLSEQNIRFKTEKTLRSGAKWAKRDDTKKNAQRAFDRKAAPDFLLTEGVVKVNGVRISWFDAKRFAVPSIGPMHDAIQRQVKQWNRLYGQGALIARYGGTSVYTLSPEDVCQSDPTVQFVKEFLVSQGGSFGMSGLSRMIKQNVSEHKERIANNGGIRKWLANHDDVFDIEFVKESGQWTVSNIGGALGAQAGAEIGAKKKTGDKELGGAELVAASSPGDKKKQGKKKKNPGAWKKKKKAVAVGEIGDKEIPEKAGGDKKQKNKKSGETAVAEAGDKGVPKIALEPSGNKQEEAISTKVGVTAVCGYCGSYKECSVIHGALVLDWRLRGSAQVSVTTVSADMSSEEDIQARVPGACIHAQRHSSNWQHNVGAVHFRKETFNERNLTTILWDMNDECLIPFQIESVLINNVAATDMLLHFLEKGKRYLINFSSDFSSEILRHFSRCVELVEIEGVDRLLEFAQVYFMSRGAAPSVDSRQFIMDAFISLLKNLLHKVHPEHDILKSIMKAYNLFVQLQNRFSIPSSIIGEQREHTSRCLMFLQAAMTNDPDLCGAMAEALGGKDSRAMLVLLGRFELGAKTMYTQFKNTAKHDRAPNQCTNCGCDNITDHDRCYLCHCLQKYGEVYARRKASELLFKRLVTPLYGEASIIAAVEKLTICANAQSALSDKAHDMKEEPNEDLCLSPEYMLVSRIEELERRLYQVNEFHVFKLIADLFRPFGDTCKQLSRLEAYDACKTFLRMKPGFELFHVQKRLSEININTHLPFVLTEYFEIAEDFFFRFGIVNLVALPNKKKKNDKLWGHNTRILSIFEPTAQTEGFFEDLNTLKSALNEVESANLHWYEKRREQEKKKNTSTGAGDEVVGGEAADSTASKPSRKKKKKEQVKENTGAGAGAGAGSEAAGGTPSTSNGKKKKNQKRTNTKKKKG